MHMLKNNPFNALSILSVTVLLSMSAGMAQANTTTAPVIENDKIGVRVGLNVILASSSYDIADAETAILPSLFYEGDRVYARGSQLGGYLIKDPKNEVAAFIQPGGQNFEPEEANGVLKGLDEREWTAMAGVSYTRYTPIGGFRAQAATDVLGDSKGSVAKLAYLARFNKDNMTIYPSIGVEWDNEDYNEYYYGISAKESAKTSLAAYNPKSSVSPYINVNINYQLTEDWAGFFGQNVKYTSDEQYDSPMVDKRATYRTTVGITYTF